MSTSLVAPNPVWGYRSHMGIRFTDSTAKHGLTQSDIIHAMRNFEAWIEKFDSSRNPSGVSPDLIIGPHPETGELLEIMIEKPRPGEVRVFHAMPLRPKFHHYLPD